MKKYNRGFSLIEVLVAILILSIGAMALLRLTSSISESNKSNKIRAEALDVKKTISTMLSCEQTLGPLATTPSNCSGPITLKNKFGNPITSTGKIGDWSIDAQCELAGSPPVNGLSIYITQLKSNNQFKIDPIRNLPLDRNHPVSSLFLPEIRPCRQWFDLASGCPNGVIGTRLIDGSEVCNACQNVDYWQGPSPGIMLSNGIQGNLLDQSILGAYTAALINQGAAGVNIQSSFSCPVGSMMRTKYIMEIRTVGWQTNNPQSGNTSHSADAYHYNLVCCPP